MGGPTPFYSLIRDYQTGITPPDPTGEQTGYDANAAPLPPGPSPNTAPPAPAAAPATPGAFPMPSAPIMPTPSLEDRLHEYLTMSQQVADKQKLQLYDAPPPVSTVANILTMGRAGTDAANYASWYNTQARQHNAAMDAQALDRAYRLYSADATRELANARFENTLHETSLKDLEQREKARDRDLQDMRHQLADQLTGLRTQAAMLGIQSYPFEHPGVALPNDTGSGAGLPGAPPGAGSPLLDVQPTGLQPQPLAGAPGQPRSANAGYLTNRKPGELPYDYAQRTKAEQAAQTKHDAMGDQAQAETMGHVRLLRQLLEDPKFTSALNSTLFNAQGPLGRAAPLASRTLGGLSMMQQAGMGSSDAANVRQTAQASITNEIRALSESAKGLRINIPEISIIAAQPVQLASGRLTAQEAEQWRQTLLANLTKVESALNDTSTQSSGPGPQVHQLPGGFTLQIH